MANSNDELNDSFLSFSSSSNGSNSTDSFLSIPTLGEIIDNNFSDTLKNFNVIHINAQSIPAHYSDLLASFDSKNIHAILVSETWLKPCLQSTSYSLPGFHLIRNDRIGRSGGGVAIYLRSHTAFSIVDQSQHQTDGGPEHLFIEVVLSHTRVLLGVYYSPSLTVDYFSSFETLLERLKPLYSHTILMGDFNTCLLKDDHRASRLKSLVTGANLHILPLAATHSFPNCLPSLLDLALVSSIQYVEKHGQYPALAFSYHDLVYLSYKIKPPKAKSRILLRRNFGGIDWNQLRKDAAATNWHDIPNYVTINEQVAAFNSLILQIYDRHAPLRPVRVRHLPAPWLTEDIKTLQRKKNLAKLRYMLKPSDKNQLKYNKARNHCNRVCRDHQRRHIHKSILEEDDSSRVWKFLESIGVGKARQNLNPQNINLNKLNKHFSSSSNINDTTKLNTLNQIAAFTSPNVPNFFFSRFTESDVRKNIMAISSDAVGADDVSRKMIIPILDIICPILTSMLNFSIDSCEFPSAWKEAQIIPLPKKNNPTCDNDYRPISILPFLSKVLERLVQSQLTYFLSKNNLLNPLQSGFRPGHSTITSLVKITDDIRMGMDIQQVTVLVLLDFSNAFGTVDFDIMLAILASLNISPNVIDWFHNYLHGRRQRIRIYDSYSDWSSVNAGVPQGGVLSPLLFSLFINNISQHITSLYHLYADDLQIYCKSKISELPIAINTINNNLMKISAWSTCFGVQLNPSKSQAIVVGSPKLISKISISTLPDIIIDGQIIPYSKSVKNLGIIIDHNMSWDPQVSEVSRKMFASVGYLFRLRNFLPIPTKIVLAQSLLLPILDYADSCYLDLKEEQLNKLERLQNLAIRFIFGLKKYDHVSDFRKKLKWLPIRLRRNTHILHLLYCVLFDPLTPPYLKERFHFLGHSHSRHLRSEQNLTLTIPSHSSSFLSNSFTVTSSRLWNALPLDIRRAKSLIIFKRLLKLHFHSL